MVVDFTYISLIFISIMHAGDPQLIWRDAHLGGKLKTSVRVHDSGCGLQELSCDLFGLKTNASCEN